MIAQQKILRVLKLIRLLRKPRTVSQLAQLLETESRTVYRYLQLLDELGYLIDSNPRTNKYFLFEAQPTTRSLFTGEETAELHRLLSTLNACHPLVSSIRRKLFLTSEWIPLADELHDRHLGRIVARLSEAIRDQRRVRLLRYGSARSNTVSNRDVEPQYFTENYDLLWAYDLRDGEQKSFKVSRIEDIEVLPDACTQQVVDRPVDAFGWSGEAPILVTLHLTRLAYQLLSEERPDARPYLMPQDDTFFPYEFRGDVYSFVGIGRFILGLPGEVRIVEPQLLKDYLQERRKKDVDCQ